MEKVLEDKEFYYSMYNKKLVDKAFDYLKDSIPLTKEETISKESKGLYKKANKNKYGIIDISEKELTEFYIKLFGSNE